MIIRSGGGQLLLIKQIDHAALAERIVQAWRRDGLPVSPRRDVILTATRRHDDGWIDEDVTPPLAKATGTVLDYVHAPDEVRRSIWPRGVARLSDNRYAAALVAQHSLHLFDKYRTDPGWQAFFERMELIRAQQLAAAAPRTESELLGDYFFVRMGDLLSLQFCDDWREPQRYEHYESLWDGTRLTVTPDPFDGRELALTVPARRLAAETFANSGELVRAIEAAPTVTLTGVAGGPRRS